MALHGLYIGCINYIYCVSVLRRQTLRVQPVSEALHAERPPDEALQDSHKHQEPVRATPQPQTLNPAEGGRAEFPFPRGVSVTSPTVGNTPINPQSLDIGSAAPGQRSVVYKEKPFLVDFRLLQQIC